MELSTEFIETHGLTEEQAKAVTDYGHNHVADIKKEYDGKANTDAEGILNGAAIAIQKATGVNRDQGEKMADYIGRTWDTFSTDKIQSLDASKKEYEDKVANFKGNDDVTAELESFKSKFAELQKKEAEFDALNTSGVKDKYDALTHEHELMKEQVAFGGVKPIFPNTVNNYEADAKWSEFVKNVKSNNEIKIVDGEAIAIDKENEYKQTKLKDLVSENAALIDLLKGRQQEGIGAKQTDLREVDGVPFKVPANVSSQELTKLVQEQISKENIGKMDARYGSRFKELYSAAKNPKQKTAA